MGPEVGVGRSDYPVAWAQIRRLLNIILRDNGKYGIGIPNDPELARSCSIWFREAANTRCCVFNLIYSHQKGLKKLNLNGFNHLRWLFLSGSENDLFKSYNFTPLYTVDTVPEARHASLTPTGDHGPDRGGMSTILIHFKRRLCPGFALDLKWTLEIFCSVCMKTFKGIRDFPTAATMQLLCCDCEQARRWIDNGACCHVLSNHY